MSPRFWRTGPRSRLWIGAGLVAILAAVYFQVRVPQLGVNDMVYPCGAGNLIVALDST